MLPEAHVEMTRHLAQSMKAGKQLLQKIDRDHLIAQQDLTGDL